MYNFEPFYEVLGALGVALVPLAIPAICAYLLLSWIADLLFRS